jgi:hypothetical protein
MNIEMDMEMPTGGIEARQRRPDCPRLALSIIISDRELES